MEMAGPGWQAEKQGHWTRNSGYLYLLSQEAFKNKEVNKRNETKRIKRVCQVDFSIVSASAYNELLTVKLFSLQD